MQAVIDKFGRIVLPKAVREELEIESGDTLDLDLRTGCLILWPLRDRGVLERKADYLVHKCAAKGDFYKGKRASRRSGRSGRSA